MKHILKSASSVALIMAALVAACLLLKVGSDLVFGNAAGWKAWVSLGALFFIAESIAAARSVSAARRRMPAGRPLRPALALQPE